MYGISIYIITNEKTKKTYWIYGSAIQINNGKTMAFRVRDLKPKKSPFKHQMLIASLNETELHHLLMDMEAQEYWNLSLSKKKELTIQLPKWSIRPFLIVNENKPEHPSALALTNNTANAKVYFALEKDRWLASIFENEQSFLDKRTVLEESLFEESTLRFFSSDSDRFGNFEIFTSPLQQSLFYPIGLHVNVLRTKVQDQAGGTETDAREVTIWVDRSLEDALPLQLNLTLWNGRGKSEAIVQDQLIPITSVGELIHCNAEEPISAVEVKLWNAEGKLLHYNKSYLMRQVNVTMGFHSGTKWIRDPWSERLPEGLKERVEKQESIGSQKFQVGDFSMDPWVEETKVFSDFLKSTQSRPKYANEESMFFQGNSESEVQFFEWIKAKIESSTAKEVILADPFFDDKAVSKILTRTMTTIPIVVLTSLTMKRSETGSSLLADLNQFLEKYKTHLPAGLTIFNVQNKKATKQQFHDRFFLVKTKVGWEGWLLGNSYNSQAQNYPSVVVKLPNNVLKDVLIYLEQLKSGQVPDRPEAEVQNIFVNEQNEKELTTAGLPKFSNWQLLMELFRRKLDENPDEIMQRLIDEGYFLASGKSYSWVIGEDKIGEICNTMNTYLEGITDLKEAENLLLAISKWSYYGLDIEPSQVLPKTDFWLQVVEKTVDIIQNHLEENLQDIDVKWQTLKNSFESFSESFESYNEWWRIYQYSFEYSRLTYKYNFILDGLWERNPHLYFELLNKKWLLFPHLLNKLHYVEKAPKEVNISPRAQRLFYFMNFDPHDRPKREDFIADLQENVEVEQRAMLTVFNHLYNDDQKVAFINKNTSLFLQPADADLVTFMLQLRQDALITLLDQEERFVSEEVIIELKKGVVSNWVHGVLEGKHLRYQFETDQRLIEKMARYSVQVYGGDWNNWYKEELLSKLNLQKLHNPFLYSHQYAKWRRYVDQALWIFHFGLMSLDVKNNQINGRVSKEIAILFKKNISDSLAIYKDDTGLLDEVLYGLGYFLSKFGYEKQIEDILAVLENRYVDPTYAFILYGSHPSIFTKRSKQLTALLQSKELSLRMEDKIIGRLIWLSKVIDSIFKEVENAEMIQEIKSLSSLIEMKLRESSKKIESIAFQFELSRPVNDAHYEKWANLYRTNIYEMKEAFQNNKDIEIFNQITGVGLYLFGNTKSFQDWIHRPDELTNDSPWNFIQNGKGEQALEELIRLIVGNFS